MRNSKSKAKQAAESKLKARSTSATQQQSMASSGYLRAATRSLQALLLRQRPAAPATSATPRALVASSATRRASTVANPPLGAEPLPEDAPRQAPPRLGEEDPVGPPTPTPKEKITGTPPTEEDDDGGLPGGMPETTPPPDVPLPPASPDGSNV
uniref:Predicted protein n=2 Tax=Hordeum vulgare subsp. vulgare TaxID=112509 RepID=F2EHC5_HORVV|nr:predicted protein [Hordeum vulgare subsp. vulgare]